MYRYDEFDAKFVAERVAQFRGQVARRLSGALTEDEFKPLRLMNGLYLQLHAYMLRIAVPYGTLNARQLRMLAHIARKYDKGYGHFTTRQNIQFNWPKLVDVPDILADLATVEMHAIQTSGNCIRNVTADHFAGAAADEIEDPRPLAEIVRQWSSLHPEFVFLPRKFKIAVSGSPHDRAALKFHDMAIEVVRNAAGETGYRVLVGGGMGRTPYVGFVIGEFVEKEDILAFLESVMRVYNQSGRRDNKYKARGEDPRQCARPGGNAPPGDARIRGDQAGRHAAGAARGARPHRRILRAAGIRGAAGHDSGGRRRFRGLGEDQRPSPSRTGLCHRDDLPEAHRRRAGRRDGCAARRAGRSDGCIRHRGNPRQPRAESRAAACAQEGPAGDPCAAEGARSRDAERRADHRHHRLPGARLLRPRQCRARSRSRRTSRRDLPTFRASTTSASSRSRSAAASMPAAIITPAISASWASTRRGWNSTSSSSAAPARKTPASATSWARASASTRSPTRWSAWSTFISRSARAANASSTPIAASAWSRFKNVAYGTEAYAVHTG